MVSVMHEENMAILKGLVSVAWADGHVAAEETEMIEGLLEAFHATPSEAAELRRYARTPRTLDDIPLTDLSFDDRRVLLQHSVLLTFADGEQHEAEKRLLGQLCERMGIGADEAAVLVSAAEERAKQSLHLLGADRGT